MITTIQNVISEIGVTSQRLKIADLQIYQISTKKMIGSKNSLRIGLKNLLMILVLMELGLIPFLRCQNGFGTSLEKLQGYSKWVSVSMEIQPMLDLIKNT